jgi:uncharacterized protein YegL
MANKVEIAVVLDRSGSMYKLVEDTIGGYNEFLAEQKEVDGEANLTLVLFDDQYEVLHDGYDLRLAPELTKKQYFTRGWTALYDAFGKTINNMAARIAKMPDDKRPDKVIVVVTTDGEENSSREYSSDQVKSLVEEKEKEGWEFMFFGANIDSFSVGGALGVNSIRTMNYDASGVGTKGMYSSMTSMVTNSRADMNADARQVIKKDEEEVTN